MSPANPTTNSVGFIRTFIRRSVSPLWTSLFARIGFANRQKLAADLKNITIQPQELTWDLLVSRDTIQPGYRNLKSVDKLQPYMLSKTVTPKDIAAMNIDGLKAEFNQGIISSISRGIDSGYHSVSQYLRESPALSMAFCYGIKTAKGIGITLGAGAALWFFGLPVMTPGIFLGTATALQLLAMKFNDGLPLEGTFGKLGSLAKNYSRKIGWTVFGFDALYLGYLVFEANLRIASVIGSTGLEGTVAVLTTLALSINHFVRKNVSEFEKSFPGHLLPGQEKNMKRLMAGAAYSSAGEAHYIGTRLVLWGAASAYLILNTAAATGLWGTLPLTLPFFGLLAAYRLRARQEFGYANKRQAEWLDRAKIYSPLWGLAAGAISSVALASVAGAGVIGLAPIVLPLLTYGTHKLGISKHLSKNWGLYGVGGMTASSVAMSIIYGTIQGPIAYATFFGSALTLFVSELHGAFHSFNTNAGLIASLKASAIDLFGEKETRELGKEKSVQAFNPHTGTKEHSYGQIFSTIMNTKPGLHFVCMYDYIKGEKNKGKLPNKEDYEKELTFLAAVKKQREKVFKIIHQGMKPGLTAEEQCLRLINNLNKAATFFNTELEGSIHEMERNHPIVEHHVIAEFIRASFQELSIRAEAFRDAARGLEAKLELLKADQVTGKDIKPWGEEIYQDWNYHLLCYDPELMEIIPVARKSVAGDEREVRKVENVASFPLYRGLAMSVAEFKEVEADRTEVEDWICGTWTRVPNPAHRWDAKAGSLQASKFLWVLSEHVKTDLQKDLQKHLSTSKYIAEVDNEPSVTQGFIAGQGAITFQVNGESVTTDRYYLSPQSNQRLVPEVKIEDATFRAGKTKRDLPANYRLATEFTAPAFDFSLMMDKNDVQVRTYWELPAIVERAKNDTFVNLQLRTPIGYKTTFANPLANPSKPVAINMPVQVLDANVELRNPDNGLIIPYKIDRGAAHVGIDEEAPWKRLKRAEGRVENEALVSFSLVYDKNGSDHVINMPPRDFPRYFGKLGIVPKKDGTFVLETNNFSGELHNIPQRDGDMTFLRIFYQDGDYAFVRAPDGKRPPLMNKDWYAANGRPTLDGTPVDPNIAPPTYYRVVVPADQSTITITDVCTSNGVTVPIARGWDRDYSEGDAIEDFSASANPEVLRGAKKGHMLGRVFSSNTELPETVDLGNYVVRDRAKHIEAAIEIVPSQKSDDKLTVIERRLDTTGLSIDRSKYLYTLTDAGTRLIEEKIPDLRWIDDIQVTSEGVTVAYTTPTHSDTLFLPAVCFRDNTGKTLLNNKKANMSEATDFYQSSSYTRETVHFKPTIDHYFHKGTLCLVVHKTKQYDIPMPQELRGKVSRDSDIKIHPAGADAAIMVRSQWIPLITPESLATGNIDEASSKIIKGQIKSAIADQRRFGEQNNISSVYPRDPYFYGLIIETMFRQLEKWGQNVAINRGKAVRANRGIQSGRTHTMGWELIYNKLADILETNDDFLVKLTNFCEEMDGVGVSEDTQMEMGYWLKGIRMWVIKAKVDVMNAEKEWGNYDKQNTKRYDYSEVLFNMATLLAKIDILHARVLSRSPVTKTWGEISEIIAGRTWYKQVFANIIEKSAVAAYLLTFGHVLFFPVDLVYFVGAWLFRTTASSINYIQQLKTLGYGFITGFWTNPALELTFLAGYLRAALRQFLERPQFGTFMSTVSGTGELIPKENRTWIKSYAAFTGAGVSIASAALIMGGLASWLLLPLGLAAIPASLGLLGKAIRSKPGFGKTLTVLGSSAAAATGLFLVTTGAPIIAFNALSIAVVANLAFGFYLFGLCFNALSEMKRADREDIIIKSGHANQSKIDVMDRARLKSTRATLQNFKSGQIDLSYQDFANMKNELKAIMIRCGLMTNKGKIYQGVEHPYRMEGFNLLYLYGTLEITLATKAVRDLKQDSTNREAQLALIGLLKESRNHIVLDYAAKMYRRLNLKLPEMTLSSILFSALSKVIGNRAAQKIQYTAQQIY